MKIQITVKPNAKVEKVEKKPDGTYHVAVKAPPIDGKANEAVIRVLAEFFDVSKSSVQVIAGDRGKKKLVEIAR